MIPRPEIHSPIFGTGLVRNASITWNRYVEFSTSSKPRLSVWMDGTYSLSGIGGSCFYSGNVSQLDDLAMEIRRIHGELKQ